VNTYIDDEPMKARTGRPGKVSMARRVWCAARTPRRWPSASSLLVALLLAGCAAGPDFRSPANPKADSYAIPATGVTTYPAHGPAAPQLKVGAEIRHDWYRIFASVTTDRLIERALEGSPTLAQARSNVDEATAQLRAQRGSLFPQVSATAAPSRSQGNAAQLGLGNMFRSSFDLYNISVGASYDLDVAGRTKRSVESTQAKLDVANAQYQSAYVTLESSVVSSAIEIATLNDEIAATQAILQSDIHRLDIYRVQERVGRIAGSAVLQLRSQIATTRATLPSLQQQRAVTQATMATLIGVPVGEFSMPALTLSDFRQPTTLPVSVPSSLVHQRPDILMAEASLHDVTAQLGIATANLYPSVTLNASYGTSTNISGDIFKPTSMIWTLGSSIAQTLFDGGTLRARRDAAKAAVDASAADYRHTVMKAFADVSNSLQSLQNDAEAVSDQGEALATSAGAFAVVGSQVVHGTAGYLDQLTSNSTLQQSRIADVEARGQQLQDVVTLYRNLGGGWWTAAPMAQRTAQSTDVSSAR
jgi:NodT family efflux transporter outer membrane factor (OMF) lipoprotein